MRAYLFVTLCAVVALVCIVGCEPDDIRAAQNRPTDQGSEVPDFEIESKEEVRAREAKVIVAGRTTIEIPENAITKDATVRLRVLKSVPIRDKLRGLPEPISNVVEVSIYSGEGRTILPSEVFKKDYVFSQVADALESYNKLKYIVIAEPNTENEAIYSIKKSAVEMTEAGLVALPMNLIIKSSLTHVILWPIISDENDSLIVVNAISDLSTSGGHSTDGQPSAGGPSVDEVEGEWVKTIGSTKLERLYTLDIDAGGKALFSISYKDSIYGASDELMGTYNIGSTEPGDASIISLNSDGTQHWIRSLNSTKTDYLQSFIHPDGRVFVNVYGSGTMNFDENSLTVNNNQILIIDPNLVSGTLLSAAGQPNISSVLATVGFSDSGSYFLFKRRINGCCYSPEGTLFDQADSKVWTGSTTSIFHNQPNSRMIPVFLASGKIAVVRIGNEDGHNRENSYDGPGIMVIEGSGFQVVFNKGFSKAATSANIALDDSKNVYWAGAFSGSQSLDLVDGSNDIFTAPSARLDLEYRNLNSEEGLISEDQRWAFVSKYSKDFPYSGTYQWSKVFEATVMSEINSIKVVGQHIYIAGDFIGELTIPKSDGAMTFTSKGGVDSFITKMTTDGEVIWSYAFGGAGNEMATRIAVGNSRQVIVGGQFSGEADFAVNGAAENLHSSRGEVDIFLMKLMD